MTSPEQVALEQRVESLQIKLSDAETHFQTVIAAFDDFAITQQKFNELVDQQVKRLQIQVEELKHKVNSQSLPLETPPSVFSNFPRNFLV